MRYLCNSVIMHLTVTTDVHDQRKRFWYQRRDDTTPAVGTGPRPILFLGAPAVLLLLVLISALPTPLPDALLAGFVACEGLAVTHNIPRYASYIRADD